MSGNGPPTALPDHGVQAAVVAGSGCKECADLRAQFEENPGGKKFSKTGIVLAAATGKFCPDLTLPWCYRVPSPEPAHLPKRRRGGRSPVCDLLAVRGPCPPEGLPALRSRHGRSGPERPEGPFGELRTRTRAAAVAPENLGGPRLRRRTNCKENTKQIIRVRLRDTMTLWNKLVAV